MEDVQLTKMQFPDENGGVSLVAKHPAFAALAMDCAKMFKEAGGINYCEWTMTAPEIGLFTLIIQRKGAVTPAENASKYRTALEEIRQLVHPKGDEPRLEGCAGCMAERVLGSKETKTV
jgi:hypothetical protein